MPFARDNVSDQIVGIEEVKRGNQCNCRCLCCNTPVTARKADVNQWHFAHRTDALSTSRDCQFSPVTAIALILRERLPYFHTFNLDEYDFENVTWSIDKKIEGVSLDAYATNGKDKTSIAIEIPFANGKQAELETWLTLADMVLTIDTHVMARVLYSQPKVKLYRPEQLFDLLLANWNDWVYRFEKNYSQNEHADVIEESNFAKEEPTQIMSTQEINHLNGICACCGTKHGSFGKGLLCEDCVNKYVGPRFNNLTDMIRHYRS